jgi:hypothetical protein
MLKIILIAMSFALLSFSAGDSADDLYKKFAETKGFKQLDVINDFKVSGKTISHNDTSQFEYYFMKPNFHRMHLKAKNVDMLFIYNDEDAFIKQGILPTLKMEDRGKSNLVQMRDMILSPIYQMYGTTYKYKLDKDEVIGGKPVYKLIRIDSTGKFMDLLISKKDYSLVKTVVVNEFKEMNVLTENFYDNYTDFKGIKIPMGTELHLSGDLSEYKIDSVLFNIGLKKFDFRRP